MLEGIHPLLTGELLHLLSDMGHSDAVAIVDANFPAAALARRAVALPATSSSEAVDAIRTVLPLDEQLPVSLMRSADGVVLDVQREIIAVAGLGSVPAEFVGREEFYELASSAVVIVRTGETRTYANVLLRKGIVLG